MSGGPRRDRVAGIIGAVVPRIASRRVSRRVGLPDDARVDDGGRVRIVRGGRCRRRSGRLRGPVDAVGALRPARALLRQLEHVAGFEQAVPGAHRGVQTEHLVVVQPPLGAEMLQRGVAVAHRVGPSGHARVVVLGCGRPALVRGDDLVVVRAHGGERRRPEARRPSAKLAPPDLSLSRYLKKNRVFKKEK